MVLHRHELFGREPESREPRGPFPGLAALIEAVDESALERLLPARAERRRPLVVVQNRLTPPLIVVHVAAIQGDLHRPRAAVHQTPRHFDSAGRSVALVLDAR